MRRQRPCRISEHCCAVGDCRCARTPNRVASASACSALDFTIGLQPRATVTGDASPYFEPDTEHWLPPILIICRTVAVTDEITMGGVDHP
jgi:hypothetical protein